MKNLIITLVITLLFGCSKEESVQFFSDEFQEIDDTQKRPTKRGYIACQILDSQGDVICAGNRCGTPVGDCGPLSACKCLESSYQSIDVLSNGMTYEEFLSNWENEASRQKLINQDGFREVDVY